MFAMRHCAWHGLCRHAVSIHVSVKSLYYMKISKLYLQSGSATRLVFRYQILLWQYSDRDPPNRGAKCMLDVGI